MAIFDIFKPKWKRSDYHVRKSAIKRITDQSILIEVAKHDPEKDIREIAINKITDQNILIEVATHDPEKGIHEIAVNKITDQSILIEVAKHNPEDDIREIAVNKIENKAIVEHIAEHDKSYIVRKSAMIAIFESNENDVFIFKNINNQAFLLDIVKNDSNKSTREIALGKMTDKSLLDKVARSSNDYNMRKAAMIRLASGDKWDSKFINGITNGDYLADIAVNESDESLRVAAITGLTPKTTEHKSILTKIHYCPV